MITITEDHRSCRSSPEIWSLYNQKGYWIDIDIQVVVNRLLSIKDDQFTIYFVEHET